jgi:hypothetical protein
MCSGIKTQVRFTENITIDSWSDNVSLINETKHNLEKTTFHMGDWFQCTCHLKNVKVDFTKFHDIFHSEDKIYPGNWFRLPGNVTLLVTTTSDTNITLYNFPVQISLYASDCVIEDQDNTYKLFNIKSKSWNTYEVGIHLDIKDIYVEIEKKIQSMNKIHDMNQKNQIINPELAEVVRANHEYYELIQQNIKKRLESAYF